MASGKSLAIYYAKYVAVSGLIYAVGLFYAFLAVVHNLVQRFRVGPSYLEVKERSLPPACLQDSAYGRHAYLTVKNVKLHYVENGDRSKPLMLFLHGFPEFWFSWRFQLKHFAATHWVVAVDLRGYGDSEKPKKVSDYAVPVLMKDVVEVVHALKRNKCTLVAHDWGGVIGWNVAAFYPDVVEKLIIMNSPHPTAFRQKLKSSIGQFLKSWYIFLFQLPYIPEWNLNMNDLQIFERCFKDKDGKLTITQEELEGFKYTFSKKGSWTPPVNYYRQNFSATSLMGDTPAVPRIKVPTLIIWGEDDLALSTDLCELARAHVEKLTIEYIPGGNHFVQQHVPEKVNRIMSGFLD